MHNVDFGRVIKRLVNDAITFRETEQRGQLFFVGVCVQIKAQSNSLKTNGDIFGHSQGAAKVEVALSSNRPVP